MKFATKHDRDFLLRKALFLRYGLNITIDHKKEELGQPVLPALIPLFFILILVVYSLISYFVNSSTNFFYIIPVTLEIIM